MIIEIEAARDVMRRRPPLTAWWICPSAIAGAIVWTLILMWALR